METENESKFLLQCIRWNFFRCTLGHYIGATSFSIYILDIFFEKSDIDVANYADGNAPYASLSDIDYLIVKLQKNTRRIFRWFYKKNSIPNAEKSHLILRCKENWEVQVSSCSIRNEDSAKVLGIHINNVLNFLLSCQSTMPEGKGETPCFRKNC